MSLEAAFSFDSYQTAWAWLHKLRRAMVRPDRDELAGVVEVDETYVGGADAGLAGRKTNKKALVVIAAELEENRIARIRLQRVRNAGKAELQAFVQNTIMEGSIVRISDGRCWSPHASTDPAADLARGRPRWPEGEAKWIPPLLPERLLQMTMPWRHVIWIWSRRTSQATSLTGLLTPPRLR